MEKPAKALLLHANIVAQFQTLAHTKTKPGQELNVVQDLTTNTKNDDIDKVAL